MNAAEYFETPVVVLKRLCYIKGVTEFDCDEADWIGALSVANRGI